MGCLRQLLALLPPTAATAVNGNGDSILHMACESGAAEVVRFLVELLLDRHGSKGALSRVVLGLNSRSLAPLHVAIAHGNSECVEALLSALPVPLAKACANQAGISDLSPLHLCSFGGVENRKAMLVIAKSVLSRGGDPGVHSNALPSTPLHLACRVGFGQLASLLLKSSAPPNAKDEAGMTALHVAAKHGETLCAMLCAQEGADGTVRDDLGRSAAHVAAGSPHGKECLLYLLALGPKMKDAKDATGKVPIMAALEGGAVDNVGALLRAGAKVTTKIINKAKEMLVGAWLVHARADIEKLTEAVKMVESAGAGMKRDNIHLFANHEHKVAEMFQRSMVKAAGEKGGNEIASRILGFVGRGWIAEAESKGVTTAMALSVTLKKTAEYLSGESDGSDGEELVERTVNAAVMAAQASAKFSDAQGGEVQGAKLTRKRRVTAEPWDVFDKPAPRKKGSKKTRKELKDLARIKNRFGM